jgi:glycosyltransferase involved in cell wall biosynthesis
MTFLAGIALKDKFQKPLVLHVHSLEYDRVGHKNVGWVYDVERFAMSKADRVISASNYTKGIIESNYGLSQNLIRTVYNAVTLPDKIERETRKHKRKAEILFAGRIDGNKGIEYFISIARTVLKKHEDVEFLVVGRGMSKLNFEEIEGFDELKGRFHYLGFVERDALFKLYSSCDVLCMPSISEPFGLTAIEAAYMNLPVVLSKKTGASEILKRTPRADFWDIQKFADHLLSIIQNPKVRSRVISNNKRDIRDLSWDKSAMEVQNIYKELLS